MTNHQKIHAPSQGFSLLHNIFYGLGVKQYKAEDIGSIFGMWCRVSILLVLSWWATCSVAQPTVHGRVFDGQGKPLPGTNVQAVNRQKSTATGVEGDFRLALPPGSVTLVLSHTGFQKLSLKFNLTRDTLITVFMESLTEQLDEVVVSAERLLQSDQFSETRASTYTLSGKEISSIPVLGGEADLIKTIQLLPGVSKGVEGTSDLFVRGGAADQNLVLLDGAPVYNTGHLFGFLSVFNPDILEGVEAMNGAFPASYGGRLSSILNVRSQSRPIDRFRMNGNVGLLASRLMVAQPVIKNKLDVWVAGRRTYIDQVVRVVGESLPYFFYDLNAKVSYRPSARDYLEFTYYSGQDVLDFQGSERRNINSDFIIGNRTQTLFWRKSLRRNLHSELNLYGTKFNYTIENTFEDSRLFVNSSIQDWGGKLKMQWDSLGSISLSGGLESVHHRVSPNVINTSGEISELLQSSATRPQTSLETSAFVQADGAWQNRWTWSVGFRLSSAWVTNKLYTKPEPRLALRYQISERSAVKASYSRMAQYLHRVSSAAVAFPTDIWYPVTNRVSPQTANQGTLAWQHVIPARGLFVSLEGYYKDMNQLIGYREGTNLFLNTEFEDQLIQGRGRAYGLEFLLKKESGKLTGWISYTLSKSTRQFDEINQGNSFLARYDRRHNGAVVANYQLTGRWSLSAVFEFISGSRFTPVIGQYALPSPTLIGVDLVPVFAPINSVKLADTHRLDLGVKLHGRQRKRWQGEWFAGVYNVYNRAAPIGISIEPNGDGSFRYQQPGLFGLLPFISYGFKFQ